MVLSSPCGTAERPASADQSSSGRLTPALAGGARVCRACRTDPYPSGGMCRRYGFRILTHNPEVSGSNPLPATKSKPESVGLWFLISPAHSGRHFSKNGGISYEPQFAGLVNCKIHRRLPKIQNSRGVKPTHNYLLRIHAQPLVEIHWRSECF